MPDSMSGAECRRGPAPRPAGVSHQDSPASWSWALGSRGACAVSCAQRTRRGGCRSPWPACPQGCGDLLGPQSQASEGEGDSLPACQGCGFLLRGLGNLSLSSGQASSCPCPRPRACEGWLLLLLRDGPDGAALRGRFLGLKGVRAISGGPCGSRGAGLRRCWLQSSEVPLLGWPFALSGEEGFGPLLPRTQALARARSQVLSRRGRGEGSAPSPVTSEPFHQPHGFAGCPAGLPATLPGVSRVL